MSRRGPEPFPWDEAMTFGFAVLRLPPAAFWSMTPRELAAASRVLLPARQQGIDRRAFAELMRHYPDMEPCDDDTDPRRCSPEHS